MGAPPMTREEAMRLAGRYLEKGVPSFPVAIGWDREKGSLNKRPLTAHGHLDATTDPKRLRLLFNLVSPVDEPNGTGTRIGSAEQLGVGLHPGPAGLVILDVDIKGGVRGDEELAVLEHEHGTIGPTPTANTASGGSHVVLTKPAGITVDNTDLAPGINVRADTGWVVAAGTRTPWGSWEWDGNLDLLEGCDPQPAPQWVLDRCGTSNRTSNGTATSGHWTKFDPSKLNPDDLAAVNALVRLGGHSPYMRGAKSGEQTAYMTRPGKKSGTSATIGYIAPGVVKVFTDNWPPLTNGNRYDADHLERIAAAVEKHGPTSAEARAAGQNAFGFVGAPTTGPAGPFSSGPPMPIGRAITLPPFPTESLPPWLAEFVESEAETTQTPADLTGVMVLAAIATAAGGRAVVEARSGWREPLNLFLAVAMPPGSRKSAVVARVSAPLTVAEREAIDRARPEVLEAATRRHAADAAAQSAQVAAGKANGEGQEQAITDAVAAAAMAEAITVPVLPRLLAEDATPEALSTLLCEQRGRVAVVSAEGDVFDLMAGRYSTSGPNLGVYLKGHAGDPLRIDRKGRPPEYVPAPALTIGIAVQPDVLTSIADRPGFRGRGLLARFLYSSPPNNVGSRKIGAPPVPAEIGNRFDDELTVTVRTLAEWEDPAVLVLSPEAAVREVAFEAELEPRLGAHGDLGHLADWGGKLAGATVRLAGLLHLAANVRTNWGQPIAAETVDDAVSLAHYFAAHAVATFDLMAADPLIANARAVAEWATEREHFSQRDAHRAHESRFQRVAQLDPVLDLLEERGWVRRRPDPEPGGKRGRPPSPIYDVNPLALRAR